VLAVAAIGISFTWSTGSARIAAPAASLTRRADLPTGTGPVPSPAPVTPQPTTTSTTAAVDPGTLPQTPDRPSSIDRAFLARMQHLWQAIVTGDPSVALPAFFPLSAYVQVKALAQPASDWQNRLVAQYDRDIAGLHAGLGGSAPAARLVGVTVPDAATWVVPGAEFNRIGYWRVYNTTMSYTVSGRPSAFVVISLISWRGQWYVVHFRTPPR